MFLRDLVIYADDAIAERYPPGFVGWFHRESCCVTEAYSGLISRKVANPDTAKVVIQFCEGDHSVPSIKKLIDITDLRWPFCFRSYVEADDQGKKQLIVESLQEALIWIAEERGWDKNAFEEAYAELRSKRLFAGWSKKQWLSPDRKYKSKINFEFGLRKVEFYICLFDRTERELGRKLLGTTVPESGILGILNGNGKWDSTNKFKLSLRPYHFAMLAHWEIVVSDMLK